MYGQRVGEGMMTRTPAFLGWIPWLIVALTLSLTCCCSQTHSIPTASAVPGKPTSLWDLIDRSIQSLPLTPDTVTNVFHVELHKNTLFWQGASTELSPELRLVATTISMNAAGGWVFTAFDIDTTECATSDNLKSHFPSAALSFHGSPSEPGRTVSLWKVSQSWGELGFSVPDFTGCINRISFTATNTGSPSA